DLAPAARGDVILIRGARLARIAQFAEFQLFRFHVRRKPKTPEARAAAAGRRILAFKEGIGEQHGILPADPNAPPARLAVGNALQPRAERPADGAEDLFHIRQADTSDEMRQ